jgi:hypothetical protein
MILIFIVGVVFWWAGFLLENDDMAETWFYKIATGGFTLSVLSFMGYGLYRATIAKPDCPKCGRLMKGIGSPLESGKTCWRIYQCPACSHKFKVSGFSQD